MKWTRLGTIDCNRHQDLYVPAETHRYKRLPDGTYMRAADNAATDPLKG